MAKVELPSAPFLAVGAPPHWHCGRTISGLMRDYLIALAPAVAGALYWYGLEAARVMALSVATAVIVEMLMTKAMERELMIDDMHAVVTGVLFAFLLPAAAPWWLVIAGSAITMSLGKMFFGGLGGSPVCAPAVGWAVCRISWPLAIDVDATMLNSEAFNPLTLFKYFGPERVADFSYSHLALGDQLGALGASQIGLLFMGGCYLIVRRGIHWQIPVAFITGVLSVGGLYYGINPAVNISPFFHLLTGSTMLAAFFLLPDYSSSPVGRFAQILYGLMGGALVIIIRVYGQYPDGVMFAVLLANLITPLADMIRPKPFGAR